MFHVPCYELRDERGFTLIELLVAIGLFAVVTSIAIGGFANALRSQRQAAALLSANSNVSLAIEQMGREMRTGYDFCVSASCSLSELIFKNARSETVTYRLNSGAIERQAVPSGGGIASFQAMTGENVNVTHLEFYLAGTQPNDGQQPRITITLGVAPKETSLTGNIVNLQTTVSSRLPLDT